MIWTSRDFYGLFLSALLPVCMRANGKWITKAIQMALKRYKGMQAINPKS